MMCLNIKFRFPLNELCVCVCVMYNVIHNIWSNTEEYDLLIVAYHNPSNPNGGAHIGDGLLVQGSCTHNISSRLAGPLMPPMS